MTKDTDLLPCPFCGGEAKEEPAKHGYAGARVVCQKCGAQTALANFGHDASAVRDWNTRSRPSGLALEWQENGRTQIIDDLMLGFIRVATVREGHGQPAALIIENYVAGSSENFDGTREEARAAVRSALGDHIADAGKMVAPLPNTEGNDG